MGSSVVVPKPCASRVVICGVRILWISAVFPLYPSYTTILLVYPLTLGIAGIAITAAIAVKKPSRRAEKAAN